MVVVEVVVAAVVDVVVGAVVVVELVADVVEAAVEVVDWRVVEARVVVDRAVVDGSYSVVGVVVSVDVVESELVDVGVVGVGVVEAVFGAAGSPVVSGTLSLTASVSLPPVACRMSRRPPMVRIARTTRIAAARRPRPGPGSRFARKPATATGSGRDQLSPSVQ
jgi:hypothetical protein